MRRPYQVAGIFLTVLALVMLNQSLQLSFYTRLGPGPGFFPYWVTLFMAFLGVVLFFQATFGRQTEMPEDFLPSMEGARRLLALVAAMVFLVATMRWLGFRVSMFAFIAFLLFMLGARRLPVIMIAALAGSVGLQYVFSSWLRIRLPSGIFGI